MSYPERYMTAIGLAMVYGKDDVVRLIEVRFVGAHSFVCSHSRTHTGQRVVFRAPNTNRFHVHCRLALCELSHPSCVRNSTYLFTVHMHDLCALIRVTFYSLTHIDQTACCFSEPFQLCIVFESITTIKSDISKWR